MAAVNSAARAEGSILLAVSRSTAIGLGRGPQHTGSDLLSPREFEVVSLVAEARTNREIARKLYISEATVKRHLANVYNKLGASSRMEAVQLAVARGILADGGAPGRPKKG
jgi:DNA-binding NarL/FixJ family response regulator